MNEKDRKGPIKGYKVFCFSKDLSELIEQKQVGETIFTVDFKNLQIYTYYGVKVLAFTDIGDGPNSTIKQIQTDAEGNLSINK